MMTITAVQIDPPKLHKTIVAYFSLDELQALCFDLTLNFDELPPGGLSTRARGLVEMCQRQRRLVALAEAVLVQRPYIPQNAFLRDIADDDAPFKGLLAFEEADEEIFFGREELTAELVARVHQPPAGSVPQSGQTTTVREVSTTNFLAIVGASGSGKSSVVRAGMIPQLRRQTNWPIHLITPTSHPLQALATSLTRDSESVTATATLMDDLQKESRALRLFSARMLQNNPADRLLLVIDQFEELFTLCKDEAERAAFVGNLVSAVAEESQLTILLTLRADFYHQCLKYEPLHHLLEQQQKIVPTMSSAELRAAIELPAQKVNLTFDKGLVDILLRDVGAADNQTPEPGALPLLSHTLLETWKRRDSNENRLNLAGYIEAGGIRGAIAKTAENTYRRLSVGQQHIARNIFLRLTELGESTQDTRRRATLDELLPKSKARLSVEQVLKILADARLVTTSDEGAEVAHETLIREWPTLQSWLDKDRDGLRLHRHLTEASQAWNVNGRDDSYLYRGGRLTQINDWLQTGNTSLNQLEAAFLESSMQLRRDELADANARAEREADAAQKLRRRALFLGGALVLAAMLAIVALVLFGMANNNATEARNAEATALYNEELAILRERETEQQRLIALKQVRSAILSTQAGSVMASNNDTELATLLAIESALINSNVQGQMGYLADDILRSIIGTSFFNTTFVTDSYVNSMTVSARNIFITGDANGFIRLWDLSDTDGKPVFLQNETGILSLTISPDGETLASFDTDNKILLWDLNFIDSDPRVFELQDDLVRSMAFSPDNKFFIVGTTSGELNIWDLSASTIIPIEISISESPIWSLTFSPDSKYLVIGSYDIVAIFAREEVEGRLFSEISRINLQGGTALSLAISPDGSKLAVGGFNAVKIWNFNEFEQDPYTLYGHESWVRSLIFSPDGFEVAAGDDDGKLVIWNISSLDTQPDEINAQLFPSIFLRGHNASIYSLAYTPNGDHLVSASWDGIRFWETWRTTTDSDTLTLNTGLARSTAFSPQSDMLVSSSLSGPIKVFDITNLKTPNIKYLLPSFENENIYLVAISPAAMYIASWSSVGTIRLWDLSDGDPNVSPKLLTDKLFLISFLEFSPDEEILATGGADGVIRLWNVRDFEEGPVELIGHDDWISAISFAPNGKMLVSAGFDGKILIWDIVNSGVEPQTLFTNEARLTALRFSPSGKYLVSGDSDGAIILFNMIDITEEPKVIFAHDESINTLIFSNDEQILASSSSDGTINILDLENVEYDPITISLPGVNTKILFVNSSEDYLISSNSNGIIRVVRFLDSLVNIGCQKVRRNLSWAEWNFYMPGEPYRQTCPNLPPHPSVPASELP